MEELRFVIGNPQVCTGCMICVNVCGMHYFKVVSPARSRARVMRIDHGLDFPLFCRNCEDAKCIAGCPNEALTRTSKGIVIVNKKKCDGTGACVAACPYYAIRIHPDTGKAQKCIQCGKCVERCPAEAIMLTSDRKLAEKDPEGRIMRLHDENSDELYGEEVRR